jgi:hypothetical protein
MKNIIYLMFVLITITLPSFKVFSQSIIQYKELNEEEFIFDKNLNTAYNSIKVRDCFLCKTLSGKKAGCTLIERVYYFSNGRIKKWISGSDLNRNKVDRIAEFIFDSARQALDVEVRHPSKGELYKYPYLFYEDSQGQRLKKFTDLVKDTIRVNFKFEKLGSDTVEKYVYFEGMQSPEIYRLKKNSFKNSRFDSAKIKVNDEVLQAYWGIDSTLVEDIFNNRRQLTERTIYSLIGNVKQQLKKTAFYYNSDGRIACQFITDEAHILYDEKFYIYSQDGWLERLIQDSPGMNLEIVYDKSGNAIEIKQRDKFSKNTRIDLRSFNDGLISKETLLIDGNEVNYKLYKYY